eukprot:359804-Chlamydomonas_euryale.AAC.11
MKRAASRAGRVGLVGQTAVHGRWGCMAVGRRMNVSSTWLSWVHGCMAIGRRMDEVFGDNSQAGTGRSVRHLADCGGRACDCNAICNILWACTPWSYALFILHA